MNSLVRFASGAALLLLVLAPGGASAQAAVQPFRVQIHVSGDDSVKAAALANLTASLQRVRDIELTTRNGEFVLSLVIVPTTAGGYAASATVMTVYTAPALIAIADRLGVAAAARERFVAQFTGAGALLDQRVVSAADLKSLCDDVARALNADVLGRERRFRSTP